MGFTENISEFMIVWQNTSHVDQSVIGGGLVRKEEWVDLVIIHFGETSESVNKTIILSCIVEKDPDAPGDLQAVPQAVCACTRDHTSGPNGMAGVQSLCRCQQS